MKVKYLKVHGKPAKTSAHILYSRQFLKKCVKIWKNHTDQNFGRKCRFGRQGRVLRTILSWKITYVIGQRTCVLEGRGRGAGGDKAEGRTLKIGQNPNLKRTWGQVKSQEAENL